MPKVISIPGGTPVNVEAAATAFGLPIRQHLIRFYLRNPSTQRAAIEQLEVSPRAVQLNCRTLVNIGVLIEEPADDARQSIYRVDTARVEELLEATRDFTLRAASD